MKNETGMYDIVSTITIALQICSSCYLNFTDTEKICQNGHPRHRIVRLHKRVRAHRSEMGKSFRETIGHALKLFRSVEHGFDLFYYSM